MVVQAETSIAENVLLFVVTCKSILQQCLTELQQLKKMGEKAAVISAGGLRTVAQAASGGGGCCNDRLGQF